MVTNGSRAELDMGKGKIVVLSFEHVYFAVLFRGTVSGPMPASTRHPWRAYSGAQNMIEVDVTMPMAKPKVVIKTPKNKNNKKLTSLPV